VLSILIWLPAAAALIGAIAGGERTSGGLALLGSLGALALAIDLITGYNGAAGTLMHQTNDVWIRSLGIHYDIGVNGLNLFLVAMTTFVFSGSLLAANLRTWQKPTLFYLLMGVAESAVLGAFLAQDLILFIAFFDLMLIPFYFLTGIWGGPNRVAATTKLVIYTLVGSLLMLAGAVALGVLSAQDNGQSINFTYAALSAAQVPGGTQDWIFLLFAAAFLIKMPAFPLHGWMPDAYREMPIEVLAVYSGVLSKVGAYGFIGIVLPLLPGGSVHYQTFMLVLALASILYGSAMAFTQTNARLVVGYSSIAQLGFITLGIFALSPQSAQGAVLQMVNHGIVVAPLLFIVALLAARAGGSEDIRDMGGIATRAPILATLFLIVTFATLAMPGSGNFVGEFLILIGLFNTKMTVSVIAFAGVVMAAVYMLRIFIRTMHNRTGPKVTSRELRWRDALVLVPFVGAILLFAVYPQLQLSRSETSVTSSISAAVAAETPSAATASSASVAPGSGTVASP
jgi:NADH-quinone oxidoreductase subunit M